MSEPRFASFAPGDVKETNNSNLWDNVDAVITAVKLTTTLPPGYTITPKPGETVAPIGMHVDFEIAGQAPIEERRVNQYFSLGAKCGNSFSISADGHRLIAKTDDAVLYTSNGTKFIKSITENGFNPLALKEGNIGVLVGLNGHFRRIEDKDAQDRTRTFETKAGEKKTVTEKPKILLCTKVNAQPSANATVPSASAVTTVADDADIDTLAADALKSLLTKKKGKPVQRSQILIGVSQEVANHPNRAEIAKKAADEAFITMLANLNIVTYDPAGKGQPVSLPVAA